MFIISINDDTCEGCGECANTCPASIISMEDDKASVTGDLTECLGCESCVSVCTSGSVTMQEV